MANYSYEEGEIPPDTKNLLSLHIICGFGRILQLASHQGPVQLFKFYKRITMLRTAARVLVCGGHQPVSLTLSCPNRPNDIVQVLLPTS